jgi:hypothetical protein
MEIISSVWFMGKGNSEGNGKGNTHLISHQFYPTGGGGFEWIAIANYGARRWVTIAGADLTSQARMMLLPGVVLDVDAWGLQELHSSCARQVTGLALQVCRMLLVEDILTADAWGLPEPHSSCARQAYLN